MIHGITSSLPSFKSLNFQAGMNVVVAEKSEGATERQTRNSSGKTSIVWILHHLLGASCVPASIFRSDALNEHSFEMDIDLNGEKIRVWRTGERHSKLFVDRGLPKWPIQPKVDKDTNELCFTRADWTAVLAKSMFGLSCDDKNSPSFRSCLPYFLRREWDGGFQRPEDAFKQMSPWNQQVNLSFLLGLDWRNPQKLEQLRQQEKTIRELKKGSNNGVLGQLVGKPGELKTRLTVTEKELRDLERQLAAFEVLPEYRELEQEASKLAVSISNAANEITVYNQRRLVLTTQLGDEQAPDVSNVENLYNEAEVVLPEIVRHRLTEVENFHERIIRNRRAHLEAEVRDIDLRIGTLEEQRQTWDERRLEIINTLSSHGAIDQLQKLEGERTRVAAEVEDLKRRLETASKIQDTKTKLTIERATVQQQTRNDHREHDSLIKEAVLLFEEFSETISDHEGSLTVDVTDNGPTFTVEVEGGRSVGIRSMQIFCFDLMLSVLWSRRGLGPGFLFHDSHLFDGVDERQVAAALQLGSEQASANGFQYIVTLNSDEIPWNDFGDDFDFHAYINEVRLSDAEEAGGLLGMRI